MSRSRFIVLLLMLGTLAVYLPVSHYTFSEYDDSDYVTNNSMVQHGLTWAGVKWAFTAFRASNWHPLTWLSHMIDCQFLGMDGRLHHCVNVVFHLANSILVFWLFRIWLNSLWPAAFVAALFAWHPLHVESVAWIAERKDVLSTFFALLALMAYTRYVKSADQKKQHKIFYILTLTCFALALMSKPMFVTLPFVMLLLDYWPLQRFSISAPQRILVEKTPFLLLALASCIITFLVQNRGGAVINLEILPLRFRLENIPVAFVNYLSKLFWPDNLCIFYPLGNLSSLTIAAAIAVLIFISTAVVIAREKFPYLLVGWLWFLGTLVPVIGLVQVGAAAMADRYTYFPSIGIFLAVALGVGDAVQRFHIPNRIISAAASLVLVACLALTHRQLNFWRNDIALFSHAITVTGENDVACVNLGVAYDRRGKRAEAMAEYREALKFNPKNVVAHDNLGNILGDGGDPVGALAEYQAALRGNPNYVEAINNLGITYVELGRFDDAVAAYNKSLELDPTDSHTPYLMGKLMLKQGRDAEAISWFNRALNISPNDVRALMYLAQVLATSENSKIRDGQMALTLAMKADELSGGRQPAVLDTLAMAEAENGNFDAAQQAAGDAVKFAQMFGMANETAAINQRLELYRNRQPFRQSFVDVPVKGPLKQ